MFTTTKQKILLISFVVLIIAIPITSYLLSQRLQVAAPEKEQITDRAITELPKAQTAQVTTATELKQNSKPSPTPKPEDPTITTPVSFGPTLSLKIMLEGRPANNQLVRLFVGIAEGGPVEKPKYLLSFTIDVPESGIFTGLSLAGLTQGNTYTAYLKGPAHVATASAFIMSPSTTKLNNDQPLTLLAGDLNEDNLVNSADFAIAKNSFGSQTNTGSFNENVDFNKDGKINSIDLGFIIKNFGVTGNSGVWVSPPPPNSSGSPIESTPSGSTSGYWLWVPAY